MIRECDRVSCLIAEIQISRGQYTCTDQPLDTLAKILQLGTHAVTSADLDDDVLVLQAAKSRDQLRSCIVT